METFLKRTQSPTESFPEYFYGVMDLCIRASSTMDDAQKGLFILLDM